MRRSGSFFGPIIRMNAAAEAAARRAYEDSHPGARRLRQILLEAGHRVTIAQATAFVRSQTVGGVYQHEVHQRSLRYPSFAGIRRSNDTAFADLLELPRDRDGSVFLLVVVDAGSRYRDGVPLKDKEAGTVAAAFRALYARGPLKYPRALVVDHGHEFRGETQQLMDYKRVRVRRVPVGHHRGNLAENANREIARRLFRSQAESEIRSGAVNRNWVRALGPVLADMNKTPHRLSGIKPIDAIRMAYVPLVNPPAPGTMSSLRVGDLVYRRISDSELPMGRRRATDPFWVGPVRIVRRRWTSGEAPIFYVEGYEAGLDASWLRAATASEISRTAAPSPAPALPAAAPRARSTPSASTATLAPARRGEGRASSRRVRAPSVLDL